MSYYGNHDATNNWDQPVHDALELESALDGVGEQATLMALMSKACCWS